MVLWMKPTLVSTRKSRAGEYEEMGLILPNFLFHQVDAAPSAAVQGLDAFDFPESEASPCRSQFVACQTKTMPHLASVCALRCVIAMNNIGCALLERNCHPQAHSTFQDALNLVSLQCSVEGEATAERERFLDTLLPLFCSKHHQAERRLSRPVPAFAPLPYETIPFHTSSPSLQVVVVAAVESVVCHPIRIDVCESGDERMIAADVLSCILMLNLATSSLSIITGEMAESRASSSVNMDNVLRFLTLANGLVEQCDDGNYLQALFLLILTLRNTVRALLEAGQSTEAATVQLRVADLKLFVERRLYYLLSDHSAASAA